VKLLAKWLIVSYAQFALHFCSQRCRTPKTSKITTVLWTESVTNNVVTLGKGKVFPYSLPSVGPGADPGVQAVSPQVT